MIMMNGWNKKEIEQEKTRFFYIKKSLFVIFFLTLFIVAFSNNKVFAASSFNLKNTTIAISEEPASCDSTGGAAAGLTCGVINAITSLESGLESILLNLLKTQPLSFSSSGCSGGDAQSCIYQIWSNFRIYGDVFLVIALLIAVIVEAVGGGMVSSYTIRKMLPRIVVAVILINLSIYVVAVLEDIFNILGGGLYDLIRAPFGTNFHFSLNSSGTGDFLGIFFAGLFAGGLAIIWESFKAGKAASHATKALIGDAAGFIILSVVLPVLIVILGVLVTLMFRQAILIFLLMISPVAFALYCLPNTEQYFRKWWDLLLKTLLVYPVIVVIFCMAEVMAIIFGSDYIGDAFLSKVMAIIAVLIPLLLVPFAFKISGGLIGTIAGMASSTLGKFVPAINGNPSNPDSFGNKRKRKFKNSREEMGLTLGASGTYARAAVGGKGNLKNRRRLGALAVNTRQNVKAQEYGASDLNNNPVWNMHKGNSDFLTAVIDKKSALEKRNATKDGSQERASWDMVIAAASQIPKTHATTVMATQQFAENAYGFPGGQKGHNLLMENAAKAAGAEVVYEIPEDSRTVVGGHSPGTGPIDDIVNIDNYGRGHISGSSNPAGRAKNGQYMTYHEMDQVTENQDLIRGNVPAENSPGLPVNDVPVAVGFSGPRAAIARQILKSHQVAVKSQRPDLANIGETRYSPVSSWNKLSWSDIAVQRPETLMGIQASMVGYINRQLSSTIDAKEKTEIEKGYQDVARHIKELQVMSVGGGVNNNLSTAAREQYEYFANLVNNVGGDFDIWATSIDPTTGKTNLEAYGDQARHPQAH